MMTPVRCRCGREHAMALTPDVLDCPCGMFYTLADDGAGGFLLVGSHDLGGVLRHITAADIVAAPSDTVIGR